MATAGQIRNLDPACSGMRSQPQQRRCPITALAAIGDGFAWCGLASNTGWAPSGSRSSRRRPALDHGTLFRKGGWRTAGPGRRSHSRAIPDVRGRARRGSPSRRRPEHGVLAERGALGSLLFEARSDVARGREQRLLALAAYGLGLAAIAHLHLALEVPLADAAWTFAVIGAAGIALTCLRQPRARAWHTVLTVAGTAGLAIGFGASFGHSGGMAGVSALAAVVVLASGLINRSSSFAVAGAALAAVSAALAWHWADWPAWSLILGYAAVAAGLFVALAPLRKNPGTMQGAVGILSVAPICLAAGWHRRRVRARNDQAFRSSTRVTQVSIVRRRSGRRCHLLFRSPGDLLGEGLYRTGRRVAVAGLPCCCWFRVRDRYAADRERQVFTVPGGGLPHWLGFRSGSQTSSSAATCPARSARHRWAAVLFAAAEQSLEPGGANWGCLSLPSVWRCWRSGFRFSTRLAVAGGGRSSRSRADSCSMGRARAHSLLGDAGSSGLGLLGVGG